MLKNKAIIIGATGLVGFELLSSLCSKPYYQKVISLARKPIKLLSGKHEHYIIDFEILEKFDRLFMAEDLFICLGTTIKRAGGKERFIQIDKDYVLESSKLFLSQGGKRIFLISSAGANVDSKIFYNRVKGETERELKKLNPDHTYIYRPSLLLGDRLENRTIESIARTAYWLINSVSQPLLNIYIGTKVSDLAEAMITCAVNDEISPGTFTNQQIKNIIKNEKNERI